MEFFTTSNGSLISGSTLKKVVKRIKLGDSFEQINDDVLVSIVGYTDFGAEDEAWEIFEHCEKLALNI
jgi:hypothetical protein